MSADEDWPTRLRRMDSWAIRLEQIGHRLRQVDEHKTSVQILQEAEDLRAAIAFIHERTSS